MLEQVRAFCSNCPTLRVNMLTVERLTRGYIHADCLPVRFFFFWNGETKVLLRALVKNKHN